MKKIIPAIMVALLSGFMFFVYEPITMYATNIDDFWFDIYIMIKPCLMIFAAYFVGVLAFYIGVYLVNNAVSKKLYVYKAFVVLGFLATLILYIQGNFLIGNLPSLDGTEIKWDMYMKETIISCVVILVVSLIVGVCIWKFKYKKTIKGAMFVMVAVFFMLSTSFVTTLTKDGVFNKKDRVIALTVNNLHNASTDSNFYIFLVDAVDSMTFKNVMENRQSEETFKDFTYYPDTMSMYRYTRDSIPYIFSSGTLNKNETSFEEYCNNAFNNSALLNRLDSEKYEINFYEPDLRWNDDKTDMISNAKVLNRTMYRRRFAKDLIKYDAFKYLPYPLKRYSRIESMDFANCQVIDRTEKFSWENGDYYNKINNNDINKIDSKYFSFIHIEGGHVPFDYDDNVNKIENGTYEQKVGSSLTVIDKFINRLRENDVYDNSVIIIMADHGFGKKDKEGGRQNPILFIKGKNEHHDMIESDKPVSFTDLNQIYQDLLNGKTSEDLLKDVDYNRKRVFLWYEYAHEDHMIEYEQTGHAWDESTLVPTGKEYDR